MSSQWQTIYPRQGIYYHIISILDAGEVYQYAMSNYKRTVIVVITFCKEDSRKWVLTSEGKINTFYAYMRNCLGTDDLKLRVTAKKRHRATLGSSLRRT